jgi:hypothetical protein
MFLATASVASAQLPALPSSVDSGRMVRMHTATGMIQGRLTTPFRATDPTLTYCRYPGPPCVGPEDSLAIRTISVSALTRLEQSPGSHWRRGAIIGGAFGAIAGGLTMSFLLAMCEYDCPNQKAPLIVLGGLVNGVAFGGIGALWGSAFPRWEVRP